MGRLRHLRTGAAERCPPPVSQAWPARYRRWTSTTPSQLLTASSTSTCPHGWCGGCPTSFRRLGTANGSPAPSEPPKPLAGPNLELNIGDCDDLAIAFLQSADNHGGKVASHVHRNLPRRWHPRAAPQAPDPGRALRTHRRSVASARTTTTAQHPSALSRWESHTPQPPRFRAEASPSQEPSCPPQPMAVAPGPYAEQRIMPNSDNGPCGTEIHGHRPSRFRRPGTALRTVRWRDTRVEHLPM
jgi:hypothetical protein